MMVALVVGGMFASVVLTGWLVRSFFVEDFWSYIAPDKSVVRNIFVRRGRVYFSHSLGKYFEIEDESRGWSYSTGKPTNPGFDFEANARKFGRSVVLAGFAYLSEPKTQFVIVIVPLWLPAAGGGDAVHVAGDAAETTGGKLSDVRVRFAGDAGAMSGMRMEAAERCGGYFVKKLLMA